MRLANKLYYLIKPFIPRYIQILLRQQLISLNRSKHKDSWPIDENSGRQPENWSGWPEGKRFALVLTHDVDTERGQKRCKQLMDVEEQLGFRSSFNFVPKRYAVDSDVLHCLRDKGFEIGVHGFCHDGKLFLKKEIFLNRAIKINEYLKKWGSVGFRSPVMQRNLDWIHELNIEYDASTYDTAIFEFESRGVGTIFPFWVRKNSNKTGYVELPYTLPQDFYLFIMMKEKNIDIWKRKLNWIAKNGGMALMNTHPDYMNFRESKKKIDEYPIKYYSEFLQYIMTQYKNQYWHVLPKDVTLFWSHFS